MLLNITIFTDPQENNPIEESLDEKIDFLLGERCVIFKDIDGKLLSPFLYLIQKIFIKWCYVLL